MITLLKTSQKEFKMFRKLFSWKGVLSRKEYFLYGVITPIALVIIGIVLGKASHLEPSVANILFAVFLILGVYMMFITAMKRARETASNTFLVMFLWLAFTPVMMIYLLVAPSKDSVEKQSKVTRVISSVIGALLLIGALLFYINYRKNAQGMNEAQTAYQKHDYQTALTLWEKAAKNGNALAKNNLGSMYLNGIGVKKDTHKAFTFFQDAAASGITEALYNLGIMYGNGIGVEKNIDKALVFFEKSAKKGYALAQYELGVIYMNGNGVEKDSQKAAQYFQEAAKGGVALAKLNLGVLYYYGEGVDQNLSQSYRLWSEARSEGVSDAKDNLNVLCQNAPEVCSQ